MIPSTLEIAYGPIPPGTWTVTFAVDPLDGVLTEDYSDEVVITIY